LITAVLVCWPNAPSTTIFAPRALSRYCSERTVTLGQTLFGPCLRTGHGCRACAGAEAESKMAVAAGAAVAGAAAAGTAIAAVVPIATTAAVTAAPMVVFIDIHLQAAHRGIFRHKAKS
jgi:hypothetical protein